VRQMSGPSLPRNPYVLSYKLDAIAALHAPILSCPVPVALNSLERLLHIYVRNLCTCAEHALSLVSGSGSSFAVQTCVSKWTRRRGGICALRRVHGGRLCIDAIFNSSVRACRCVGRGKHPKKNHLFLSLPNSSVQNVLYMPI
jgi:hypothetical protein